jgi:hypothetical protein
LGTAKAAGFLEISLAKATARAALGRAGAALDLLCRAESKEQIGKGKAGGIVNALRLGATVAQIDLLHLPVDDLGQEDTRLIGFANIAGHGLDANNAG